MKKRLSKKQCSTIIAALRIRLLGTAAAEYQVQEFTNENGDAIVSKADETYLVSLTKALSPRKYKGSVDFCHI